MATDYNQALLDRGYTQEQINNMRSVAASWGSNQEIVKAAEQPVQSTTSTSTNWWPADWYANATERNMATWGSEFGRNTTETPATPATKNEDITKTEDVVKTEEIKQEGALKPLSQEYYNQTSQEAQDKIVKNLNDYKQSNPEYFRDYESFKKNFSYDARDAVQKNTLDQWYKWYQDWLTLSNTPTTDLYTQYKDWSLSDTQLQSLRVSDPTKYAELQNMINKGNIIAAYDDDKWVDTGMSIQDMAYNMMQQTFMQFMSGESSSWASQYFRDYEEKMSSPEMLAISDKTTELQEQIENIQDDIATMQRAVEKEYEWTWASRAKISAIVADRTYDLQLQLRTANSEYNKYATQYNNRMQQYQNEFQLQLQEYQINQQERQQMMSELWFAMDLMSFETPQQAQEREWNYWVKQQEYQNGNINSKDYSTRYKAALTSVQNLLSQYEWIPMVRSAEQMADDILKAIDNGSTLGEELTKINQQIQKKPEYKYLYNNTFSSKSSSSWIKTFKLWNTEYVEYGDQLYTAEQFNKLFKWDGTALGNAKAYDVVDESALANDLRPGVTNNLGKFLIQSKNLKWNKGWQCWKFVNDYLQYIWMTDAANRYYDNDLSTKLNSVNSYSPKEGTIAVFDYNFKGSDGINHGHVGIVTKVYEDGSFDIRDSNRWSDEKIDTRHVTEWDKDRNALQWFFDPSQPAIDRSSTVSTNTLSNIDISKKENYIEEAKRWMLTDTKVGEIWDLAAEQWWGEERREALLQGKKMNLTDAQIKWMDKTDSQFSSNAIVKEFEDAVNQIQQLQIALNDASWVWDMSAIFTFMKTLDPSSVVRESEFNSAAATAWVLNPQAIWQSLEKSVDWKFLTTQQREDFKKIAKEFIKVKANNYQTKYNDLLKRYDYYGIDKELAPTNMADVILASLNEWISTTNIQNSNVDTAREPKWDEGLKTNNWWSNSFINIDWYEFNSNW